MADQLIQLFNVNTGNNTHPPPLPKREGRKRNMGDLTAQGAVKSLKPLGFPPSHWEGGRGMGFENVIPN
jgi:hypothetical protein